MGVCGACLSRNAFIYLPSTNWTASLLKFNTNSLSPQTTEGTARLTPAELGHKWGGSWAPCQAYMSLNMCWLHLALFSVSFAHIPLVTMPFFVYSIVVAHVSRANDLQMPRQVCFRDEGLTRCETQADCLAWPKARKASAGGKFRRKTSCPSHMCFPTERFTCLNVWLQRLTIKCLMVDDGGDAA